MEPAAAVEDSVRAHLVSDVPVAVFLSAGLDSGLIAALARRHLPEPPATFTLRFDALEGTPQDEAPLAAEVARRLGTRHVERRMGRADFARTSGRARIAAMDQPSIDGFNTYLVSRAAHEAGLKVVLSGLGGDEIFGSYPSFADVPRLERAARRAGRHPGARRALARRRQGARGGPPEARRAASPRRDPPRAPTSCAAACSSPRSCPRSWARDARRAEGLAALRSGGGRRPGAGRRQRPRPGRLDRRPRPGDRPLHAQPAPARLGLGLDGLVGRAAGAAGGRLAARAAGRRTASSPPAARARRRSSGSRPPSCRRPFWRGRRRGSTSRSPSGCGRSWRRSGRASGRGGWRCGCWRNSGVEAR